MKNDSKKRFVCEKCKEEEETTYFKTYNSLRSHNRKYHRKLSKWNGKFKLFQKQQRRNPYQFHENILLQGVRKNMTWEKQEGGYWKPEKKGDELIGKVIAIDEEGRYGIQYTIEQEKTGETFVTPSHKVLQARMIKAKKDDKVKIVFIGTEAPAVKGNNPTSMYDVYIDN